MASTVFRYVKVLVSPVTQYYTIEWRLSPSYHMQGTTLNFYVEVARNGGDWTRLNASSPVVNSTTYTDTTTYQLSIKRDLYYRVVLDDSSTISYSAPTDVYGDLTERERRIASEVMRRKYVQMVKSTGVLGYLVCMREYGTKCTCSDPDLNTSPTSSCLLCWGTGVLGGFYEPVPFYMEFLDSSPMTKEDTGSTGIEMKLVRKALCVPFPSIYPEDMWVDANTGERYVVEKEMKREVYIRNTPLVVSVTMTLMPPTDPEYQFPISATASDSLWVDQISFN
jgi:hypothetical protein